MNVEKEDCHSYVPLRNLLKPGSVGGLNKWKFLLFLGGIILTTFLIYLPSLKGNLLDWDDYGYIQNNPLVSSINLKDIFSHNVMWNYHPLTILVLAIEYHFFGLNATGYHAVNLLIHLANVILVCYAIFLLSDNIKVTLIASLLFGIHPLHVESVAWVAELKDLLYTFFFLAGFIFYLKYIKTPRKKFYVFVLLLFVASALSKGMAVSFPLVMILTDYFRKRKFTKEVLFEKVPFLLLSAIFGVVAILAQKNSIITEDLGLAFPQRIVIACYGFITYLFKMVLPFYLSAFYPYPHLTGGTIPTEYYAYLFLAVGFIVIILHPRFQSRKIIFGFGFYTATIFLVLQWLPVGNAIMADRYSYVPSIGIFFLFGEGFAYLLEKRRTWAATILLSAFAVFFSVKTYNRCFVWNNDLSLWNDVIDQYNTSPIAYNNRGLAFLEEQKYDVAIKDFNMAIGLNPNYALAFINRGNAFRNQNEYAVALDDYTKAIILDPGFYRTYFSRATLFLKIGKNDEALNDFNKTINLNPSYVEAYVNRGILYMNMGEYGNAILNFDKAIELNPNYTDAYINRGNAFSKQQRYEDAINNFTLAIRLNPNGAIAFFNKGLTEYRWGKKDAARSDLKRAAELGYRPARDAIQDLLN